MAGEGPLIVGHQKCRLLRPMEAGHADDVVTQGRPKNRCSSSLIFTSLPVLSGARAIVDLR